MKISTKGRYALRLMLDIARYSGGDNVSLKDVSERQGISLKYLEQIVNALCKAGYLKSQRGSQGGYKMTRKPEEYTVGDILRVTEGDMAPVSCLEGGENLCPRKNVCPTIKFWEGLYKTITSYIDGTTIADLVRESENLGNEFEYYI